MALSVHCFSDSLQPWQEVRRLCSPRVSQGTWNRGESIQPAAHGFSRRHDSSWDLRGRRANPAFARSVRCAKAIGAPERRRSRRAGWPLQHRPGRDRSAGNPVSDLAPWDFTLLDNGQPAKIRTLHNSLEASEPAPELIFVLDAINLSPQQLTQTESAIVHFLRRNSGRLRRRMFSLPAYTGRAVLVLEAYAGWKSAGQRGGAAQVSANGVEIGSK